MADCDRRTAPFPLIGVGAVLLSPDLRHVLLVQRGSPPAEGQWSVPGGLLERGERLCAACARELTEETGLVARVDPEPVKILERVLRDEEGNIAYHYVIVDFHCEAVGGELNAGSDVRRAEWIGLEQLDTLDTTTGLREVIDRTVARARGSAPRSPLLG